MQDAGGTVSGDVRRAADACSPPTSKSLVDTLGSQVAERLEGADVPTDGDRRTTGWGS